MRGDSDHDIHNPEDEAVQAWLQEKGWMVLRTRWGRLLILLCILRMAAFLVAQSYLEGGVLVDSRPYLEMASGLRQGGWPGLNRFGLHWTPGYPIFLAMSEWLTGTSLAGAYLLQLALTGASCLLLVWIGVMLRDSRIGIAAGILYAVSPNTAFWSLTIMSETLFSALLVLALALWLSFMRGGRAWAAVLTGVSLGAATFVRPIGLLLLAAWLAACVVASPRGSLVILLRKMALFVGAFALVLAPWMVRNWRNTGRLVLADVGRDTFVQFNLASVVAEAEGITRDEAASQLGASIHSWTDGVGIVARYPIEFLAQQATGIGRSVMGVESGVWARQLGLGIERQGSFEVLSALLSGGFGEASERLSFLLAERQTKQLFGLAMLAILYTAIVYLLSLAGLPFKAGSDEVARASRLLVIFVIAHLLIIPGAAGQARFRIPAEPFLAVLAGGGLVGLIDWARDRKEPSKRKQDGNAEIAGSPASEVTLGLIGSGIIHSPGGAHNAV